LVIAITHATLNANRIAEEFRRANPPIIGRIQDDRFMLDLRTIFDLEDLLPNFSRDKSHELKGISTKI
jgi:hypothetical protein